MITGYTDLTDGFVFDLNRNGCLLFTAEVDTTLADANNDGIIDIRDLVRVKRLSLNIQ